MTVEREASLYSDIEYGLAKKSGVISTKSYKKIRKKEFRQVLPIRTKTLTPRKE